MTLEEVQTEIAAFEKYLEELNTKTVSDDELMKTHVPELKKSDPDYGLVVLSIRQKHRFWLVEEKAKVRLTLKILGAFNHA